MTRQYTFLTLTKDRSSRWVVSIQFDWFLNILYFPQRTVREVLNRLVMWMVGWRWPSTAIIMSVASAGLGIGLVVALFTQVLSQPSSTLAVPAFLERQSIGPEIDRVKLGNVAYQVGLTESVADFYTLPRKQIAALQTAGRPTEATPMQLLVGFTHPSRSIVQEIELGEEIIIIGDNNGRYTYQVVATQVQTADQVAQLDSSSALLYIVVPQTITHQQFLVILAK
jgi:hypothetical protein